MANSNFKVFRWIDFLSFGLLALAVTAVAIYAIIAGTNLTANAIALLIVMSLAFYIPYVVILVARHKRLSKINFITKHGIAVFTGGFDVSKEEVENITAEAIILWKNATKWKDAQTAVDGLFIYFKEYPVERNLSKFAGYLIGKHAVIGWKEDLDKTALFHELGHAIHREWTGKSDNDAAHKFMKAHNLP